MTLILATNSHKLLSTHGSDSNAAYFDPLYVSYSSKVSNNYAGPMINFDASVIDTVWIHFSFRVDSNHYTLDGNAGPWVYDEFDNRLFYFEVQDGKWASYFNADTAMNDSKVFLGTGLNTYDLKFQITGGVMFVEYWRNGTLYYNNSGPCVNGRGLPRKLKFASNDAGTLYVSELIIQTSSTVGRHLKEMKPTGQGSDDAWTGGFSELGDTDDLTVASTAAVGARESSTMDAYNAPTTGGIECVSIESFGSKTLGSPANLNNYVKIGAVDYDGSVSALGESPTRIVNSWEVNPATGLAWTFAELDTLQIGLKSGA